MKKYVHPVIMVRIVKHTKLCVGSAGVPVYDEKANDEIGAGAKGILINLNNNIDAPQ